MNQDCSITNPHVGSTLMMIAELLRLEDELHEVSNGIARRHERLGQPSNDQDGEHERPPLLRRPCRVALAGVGR